MNAAGAFSSPSVTSSRQRIFPSATQRARRIAASSYRCAKSVTRKPSIRAR